MHRIFQLPFSTLYPLYVTKLERKGRTTDELDEVIRWLTGFEDAEIRHHVAAGTPLEEFFAAATLKLNVGLITGVICARRGTPTRDLPTHRRHVRTCTRFPIAPKLVQPPLSA